MPSGLTRLEIAEWYLLAVGGVLILGTMLRLSLTGRWADVLSLPAGPAHDLQPVDLLVGLAAAVMLPSLFYQLLSGWDPSSPATQPTGAAAESPTANPIQIVSAALGQLVTAGLIMTIAGRRFAGGLRGWGLRAAGAIANCGKALAAYVAIWPLCFGVLHLTVYLLQLARPGFEPPEHFTIRALLSGETAVWQRVALIASALVLAPLVEEFLFRGLLQPALTAWSRRPWLVIVVCGAAFGLFHHPLTHVEPALTVFGVFLGFLYAKTGSLTLVILTHAIFNGKTLLWLAVSC